MFAQVFGCKVKNYVLLIAINLVQRRLKRLYSYFFGFALRKGGTFLRSFKKKQHKKHTFQIKF